VQKKELVIIINTNAVKKEKHDFMIYSFKFFIPIISLMETVYVAIALSVIIRNEIQTEHKISIKNKIIFHLKTIDELECGSNGFAENQMFINLFRVICAPQFNSVKTYKK
jgi:hypothetical protein